MEDDKFLSIDLKLSLFTLHPLISTISRLTRSLHNFNQLPATSSDSYCVLVCLGGPFTITHLLTVILYWLTRTPSCIKFNLKELVRYIFLACTQLHTWASSNKHNHRLSWCFRKLNLFIDFLGCLGDTTYMSTNGLVLATSESMSSLLLVISAN